MLVAILGRDGRGAEPGRATDALPRHAPPTELWDVERVVDGDTLEVLRHGRLEVLRLACVDAEERIATRPLTSRSAPRTVFGEETALWMERLLAGRARDAGRIRVGISLPAGDERRDPFGRLLCHVLLPDGTDLNLLLVRQGRSPYYEKYGASLVCHGAFVRAQEQARRERLGIWDPRTNRARTPGAPEAVRPYGRLLAWWRARALAVESWRAREAGEPERTAAAGDPEDLRRARAAGGECRIFGSLRELREEDDGSLVLAFHGARAGPALRALVPRGAATVALRDRLRDSLAEFRQNYWWIDGVLAEDGAGFFVTLAEAGRLSAAGPEPEEPARAPDAAEDLESAKAARRFDESSPRTRHDG